MSIQPVKSTVSKVMVGTDRSATAEQAVRWAAQFAERYGADLFVVQVIVPQNPAATEFGAAERTRAAAAAEDLTSHARELAGERGRALVVLDVDPAGAICQAAEQEDIDVLVVGNYGMAGRKEFLLGNVPNRISHNARCTVIIVNTLPVVASAPGDAPPTVIRHREPATTEPRLAARGAEIAAVMAKHGLRELFGRPDEEGTTGRRREAKRLRSALEELGPTFSKLGQILSTRPDLLPPEYIEELALLQDQVPPLAERDVVHVSELELGVPWEDVFESIEPKPLAAGTIAQVHRATLAGGRRVVVKVQRPNARREIEQDLALLEVFAERISARPALQKVIDMQTVFEHLSNSLHRELDFRQEAGNIERMREVLVGYDRLDVPAVHRDLSTSRLLVMEEIQGVPINQAPDSPERKAAARQLLESYYKQIMVDGFFHADPHPGNLMWWNERIYFLDFGMVGSVSPDIREHLTLLLMSFWQGDAEFLSEIALMLSSAIDRSDLDLPRFQSEIGELMGKYRTAALADMQIGAILQEMSEIALRHEVPMPAELTLIGKALAQVQLATAQLDPELDPFEVAGRFLAGSLLRNVRQRLSPKAILYESQKLKLRVTRVIESFERLVGARPGKKLEVNFQAGSLEETVRHTGQRLAAGLTAAASALGCAITVVSPEVADWIPASFGGTAAVLTLGLIIDLFSRR
ncbi:MAG: AarF/UbiB family protein [Methylotetracoccus sp.]